MRVVSLHVRDVDLCCEIMVSLNGRGRSTRIVSTELGVTDCYYLVALFPSKTNIRTNAEFTTGKNSSLKFDLDNQNQTIQMVRTFNTRRELGNGRFYHAPGA